ncbi:MAG: HIT family protein [Sphaerochaetaceae bacterium]|nr:HIT family protein [Sphaerochaetaceae bacterium]
METLFTKIEQGIIPSTKIYEDDYCFVILDINPVKKGHALVISRQPNPNIASCPDDILQHMIVVAKKIDAKQREVLGNQGSNIIINNDPASGQEVPHLHIHVIPRFEGDNRKHFQEHDKYQEGEMQSFGDKLRIN